MTSGRRASSPTTAPCKSIVHCSSASFKAARCRLSRRRRPAQLFPHHLLHIANLFSQQSQLPRQPLNLSFGSAVYVVILFAAQAIFRILPVLAHHDDGSL